EGAEQLLVIAAAAGVAAEVEHEARTGRLAIERGERAVEALGEVGLDLGDVDPGEAPRRGPEAQAFEGDRAGRRHEGTGPPALVALELQLEGSRTALHGLHPEGELGAPRMCEAARERVSARVVIGREREALAPMRDPRREPVLGRRL